MGWERTYTLLQVSFTHTGGVEELTCCYILSTCEPESGAYSGILTYYNTRQHLINYRTHRNTHSLDNAPYPILVHKTPPTRIPGVTYVLRGLACHRTAQDSKDNLHPTSKHMRVSAVAVSRSGRSVGTYNFPIDSGRKGDEQAKGKNWGLHCGIKKAWKIMFEI